MQTIANYPVHPAAELFPMMPDAELQELVADIKKHGLLRPVEIYQGQIIDGRNRAKACELAGVTIRTAIAEIPENILPTEYVLSLNAHRRHLTPSQKAAAAVGAIPLLEKEANERQRLAGKLVEIVPQAKGRSRDLAAASVGANPRYVQDAKAIQEKAPEVFEQVKTGEKTIPEAKRELDIVKRGLKTVTFCQKLERLRSEFNKVLASCEPGDITDIGSLRTEMLEMIEEIDVIYKPLESEYLKKKKAA